MLIRASSARLAVAAAALVATACGGGDPSVDTGREALPTTAGTGAPATGAGPTPTPTTTAPTAGPRPLEEVAVRLSLVARVAQPVDLATRPGDTALYVAEKGGRVRAVRDGAVDPAPVLDLAGQVSTGSEQGLLGLAFSPGGDRLYVDYTDTSGDTRVVEYRFDGGRADPSSARELLFVDQPYANHNGGQIAFGPDGMLWIGMGDGGAADDPENRAQDLGTVLGKLLRVDPAPSAGRPYTIPPDNPFVGREGARGEIWSYGLRNPWRFSFDRATGDLWIGDVGQDAREEVDFAPTSSAGGENWGWPGLEGTLPNKGPRPDGARGPVVDHSHGDGWCSVVGGFVYRGEAVPALTGAYVYGDYCRGEVVALRQSGGRVTELSGLGVEIAGLSSFGQDSAGELYALSLEGAVFRIDG